MQVQSPVSQAQMVPMLHLSSPSIPEATHISSRDMEWDNQRCYSADSTDIVAWNYYTLPPSPPASVSSNTDDSPELNAKTIRPRFISRSPPEIEQEQYLPTNQVFDFDGMEPPSSSSSASPSPSVPHQLTPSSDNGASVKKPFSTIGGVKKGRGSGERITTKDFVPPDVTGLSKREARLLKNRAAAFLSRQRKREEFEAMEIRVKELEEENARLQALAEKGRKYDSLLSNMEQLRLRLSVVEKREQDLAVELANRTASNLAMKTESQDSNLSPTSYSSYAGTEQASVVSIMKQSLLSLLPSLLALPQHATLPITFSIPLTDCSSARSSSSPYGHSPSPCDIKDHGRPRYGHGRVGFHPSSADIESSKKMFIGGEAAEGRRFDMDGLHSLGSLSISFDASPTEDGSVRVHVSERNAKAAIHWSRQRTSLAWSGTDPSLTMPSYSPPLSTPINAPLSGGIDHLGVFAGTGSPNCRLGFDTQLMTSGYSPFTQAMEKTLDYYPGLVLE